MKTESKIQWLLRLTAGATILMAAAGCAKKNDGLVHGEQFSSEDTEHSIHAFNAMEAANASRADATLRAYHFDDMTLNSLGQARLDSMLRSGAPASPLVVYVDLPAGDAKTEKRNATITAFLKDRGLTDEQIVLKSGPNPDVNSPVAPLLSPPPAGGSATASTAK